VEGGNLEVHRLLEAQDIGTIPVQYFMYQVSAKDPVIPAILRCSPPDVETHDIQAQGGIWRRIGPGIRRVGWTSSPRIETQKPSDWSVNGMNGVFYESKFLHLLIFVLIL
jgi:hypothetical protein